MSSRMLEEFKDLNENPIMNCGVTVGLPNEDEPTKWKITLSGPKDTSYSGGIFLLSIQFPSNYPEAPPEICFITPIYHVNVNPRVPKSPRDEPLGHISLSTLYKWRKEYKIKEIIYHIYMLFYMGNPDSPYELDMAYEMKNNRKLFEEKIKYFTKKYASTHVIYCDREHDWNFNYP